MFKTIREFEKYLQQHPQNVCDLEDGNTFDKACRLIATEFEQAKYANGKVRRDGKLISRHVWLGKTCYPIIQYLIGEEVEDLLFGRIDKYSRQVRGSKGTDNIFQTALMAISAHDPMSIRHQDRERHGKNLMIAHRHFVPVEFLEGFLSKCSVQYFDDPTNAKSIDSNFENWIIEHSIDQVSLRAFRDKYPRRIQTIINAKIAEQNYTRDDEDWPEADNDRVIKSVDDVDIEDDDEYEDGWD